MRCTFFFLLFSLCLLAPRTVFADSYYARSVSVRRGSEIVRFTAAASFVWNNMYGETNDLQGYICSLRNLLPDGRGAGFLSVVTVKLEEITGVEAKKLEIMLTSGQCRKEKREKPNVTVEMKTMMIDAKGRIISKNPVWNACTHAMPLSAELMRSNPDMITHRQGRIITLKPKTCRDYHRGDLRVWTYADDPSVEVVLDKRGRLLGDAPFGYVLEKKQ